jgi:hypothetical protein
VKGEIKMLVKIKSYQPYSNCYSWYGYLVGKTVKVKKARGYNRDYIIDDGSIITTGTIFNCGFSADDVEIISE